MNTKMEEPGNSRWALVIRDDGEASVVPLSNVSVLQDGADGDEKNPTVIVLQTDEQGDITHESHVGLNITEEIGVASNSSAENINPFISLSSSQVEESGDLGGAVITIGEAGQQESTEDVETIENIQISVLAQSAITNTSENQKVQSSISVNSCQDEPVHVVRAHTQTPKPTTRKSVAKGSVCRNIDVKSLEERASSQDGKEKDEQQQVTLDGSKIMNTANAGEKESIEEQERQKKEDYLLSLNAWTKRLPSLASGALEPFKKVEATLHKDLSAELGIESDKGIFFSLHQQGVARGVRVVETGPEQIVVSGSLVELLASRDVILSEIEKIKGTSVTTPPSVSKTCEIGIMCELIPSPPSARYASSAGLDRSARRYHSVLSRPISPEPRPQRKRSRRHLVSESKVKSSDKLDEARSPSRCQKKRSESRTVRNLKIKVEKDNEERQTERNALVPKESNPSVEILLGDLKMEPECDETIIVSSINDPDPEQESQEERDKVVCKTKSVAVIKNCKTDTASPLMKEDGVRNVDERGQVMRRCLEVESSNKENIEIDNPQFLCKTKELVDEEEGLDLDVEDHKIVCEPEINVSEGQDDELSKVHSAEEVKFKFSCQICSYKSMRENHFVKHMKLHDKGLALYKCDECNFVSIRASHLRRHKMSHAQQVLNCHMCSYICDDQKLLTKHVRVKHQASKPRKITGDIETQAPYECDECDYKTSWNYAFQRHRRTHASSKLVSSHSCPQCPYKTMRREHFLRHIKNVHQNHRPFLCDICGKAFKRQDALKQHHVTHYQNLGDGSSGQMGPYGFVCHICQKVCRSAAYLKEHMATHSEERSFLCEVCGASFKTRSVQRNHVQTIHRRPRSFTCHTCEKKFNTKYALRRHMKQHDTSLEDGDILPDGNSEQRMCDIQPRVTSSISRSRSSTNPPLSPASTHPPPVLSEVAATSRMLVPSTAPPPAAPAYHFTIGGQPAFILPHIDGQHAAIEEGDPSVIEEGSTVIVSGDGTNPTDLRTLAGQSASTAISVPVVPTAVHIVNQDQLTAQPGDIIISSDHYQPGRGPAVVTSETANYVAQEHGSSTLLYLTGNFN